MAVVTNLYVYMYVHHFGVHNNFHHTYNNMSQVYLNNVVNKHRAFLNIHQHQHTPCHREVIYKCN